MPKQPPQRPRLSSSREKPYEVCPYCGKSVSSSSGALKHHIWATPDCSAKHAASRPALNSARQTHSQSNPSAQSVQTVSEATGHSFEDVNRGGEWSLDNSHHNLALNDTQWSSQSSGLTPISSENSTAWYDNAGNPELVHTSGGMSTHSSEQWARGARRKVPGGYRVEEHPTAARTFSLDLISPWKALQTIHSSGNPWAPWRDEAEWKLVVWLVLQGVNKKGLNEYISLQQVSF